MPLDLDAHSYRRHGTTRLWVRTDSDAPDFGYNDGDDYETWVASAVRDATDVSSLSREIEGQIRDWPSRYHLSHRRANLIRPLLDQVTGPVLEIGAGMGAVTRALGESGVEVVAVEGSPRRAAVCADRVRDLDNVQVVADTIQGFGVPRRFPTVVMVGVLEYSRVFGFEADGRDPVDVMLEHVVSLLEPDGTLVLAIENQLGLKYFAGFPEDHVGRRMFGVEDQYTADGVVTFGRRELGRRLSAAGLPHHDWYYPFPDYKLPTTIVAEAALDPEHGFDPTPLVAGTAHADFQEPAVTTMDLGQAWAPVIRNDLLRDLSSSFLVRASAAALSPANGLAWYYGGAARRPEFAKATVFQTDDAGVVVRRVPARPELPHAVGTVQMHLEDERYTRGDTAADHLAHLLRRDGWSTEHLIDWFGEWLDAFRAEAGLSAASPAESVVPGRLMDALPRNLLLPAVGDARFIDLEWSSTEDLTLSYAAFRALYDALASQHDVAQPAAGTPLVVRDLVAAVAAAHGIRFTDAVLAAHWERERTFQATVVGGPVPAEAREALTVTLHVRADLDAVIADHQRLPDVLAEQHARHAATRAALRDQNEALDADREAAHVATATARAELAVALGAADGLRTELEQQQETVSWQATAPLRQGRRLIGRARRAAGRLTGLGRATPPPVEPVPAPEDVTDPDLDLDYYRARYPDIAPHNDAGVVAHWRERGRAEGRSGRPLIDTARVVRRRVDPSRDRVLVVLPDAARDGSAVHGWNLIRELGDRYDVVAVLLRGGPIQSAIESEAAVTVTFEDVDSWYFEDATLVAADLVDRFDPIYALAISAATHPLAASLERAGVAVVALVHEFASTVRPKGILSDTFVWVSELVFPAQIVAESMNREYADLKARDLRILLPGPDALPGGEPVRAARATPRGTDGVDADLPEQEAADLLADLDPDTVLVLGWGDLDPRRGAEFFLQAAERVHRVSPGAPVHFAWVGDRDPELQWYVDELHQQVLRSGADDRVTFLAPTADPGTVMARADVFLLSARLEAMPNTVVHAALAGVPVVAFDGASGMADWLSADEMLRELVVPHLDAGAAGDLLVRLADDPAHRASLGGRIQDAARLSFDLPNYARRIDELGVAAHHQRTQLAEDIRTITEAGGIDADLYTYAGHEDDSPAELVADYVRLTKLAAPLARSRSGILVRRPVPGFHPLVFAEQAPDYDENRDGEPYATWLRRGRPAGPWAHEVLRPGETPFPAAAAGPQVLVHGHFHYPELIDDLTDRLSGTTTPFHLLITTGSREKRADIEARLAGTDIASWAVEVVPNQGRDLGPLLTGVGTRALDHDLLLHVHSKKSPHAQGDGGDRWRSFLFENLIGGQAPMMDEICARFAADPALGLVSPEDPHLNDWDLNRAEGEDWARRFDVPLPLPTHFDFPLGTMFWARTQALRPLLEAGLVWDEYPPEPLPVDGSSLHALERIIPFVVAKQGYGYMKTVVPGIRR